MSVVRMDSQNTDYDAAQALLDLQGNMKPGNSGEYVWRGNDSKEDMEKAAKLFWNCFISTEIPTSPNTNILDSNSKIINTVQCPVIPKAFEDYGKKITTATISKENASRVYKNIDRKFSKIADRHNIAKSSHKLSSFGTERKKKKSIHKDNTSPKIEVHTREIGTQTEECYFNPNIELMETTIKNLCERIQALEAQLKEPNASAEQSGFIFSENEAKYVRDNISDESQNGDFDMSVNGESVNESNASNYSEYSRKVQSEHSNCRRRSITQKTDKNVYSSNKVLINHNVYTNYNDLVPIGDGHATVPSRVLKHINWNSYTSATRKLLTAVFTRRILATHSLTGKPSPAFPNKPAKKKLDAALVNDIVQTVVERCSVPENVVRTSITTKCADESKMFRTRQRNVKKRNSKKDRENVSPITSDSESDNY